MPCNPVTLCRDLRTVRRQFGRIYTKGEGTGSDSVTGTPQVSIERQMHSAGHKFEADLSHPKAAQVTPSPSPKKSKQAEASQLSLKHVPETPKSGSAASASNKALQTPAQNVMVTLSIQKGKSIESR